MSYEGCIHGLGPVYACVICNGRAKAEAQREVETTRTFPAKYSGHCRECDLPIHVGQSITWTPDRPPTHEECAW